jgi:hypothetical protein
MKMRILTATAMAVVMALTGCSGDDDNNQEKVEFHVNPNQSIILTEDVDEDVQSVERIQSYIFKDGKLLEAENRQIFSIYYSGDESEQSELVQTTSVSRGGNTVTMTDSYGNVNVYVLNGYGMAESCVRTEAGGSVRMYDFKYVTVDGRLMLSSVSETINSEEGASISISYDGDEMHIVRKISGESLAYTAKLSGSGVVENPRLLPSLFLAEMHPLSLHLPALYSCMLGYPTKVIGGTVSPDDTTYNETVYYTYSVDDDSLPTSCEVKTVSKGHTYLTRSIHISLY